MNDFSELESELKRLRPAAVSPELMQRVEIALNAPVASTPAGGILPRRRKVAVNWFALGFGLAAAAAFLMLARVNTENPAKKQPKIAALPSVAPQTALPNESSNYVPDGITRVVYNRQNEGLVFPANADRPVRRVRSRSHETLQWKNPDTGASLRVSYPTEEIELIPVHGQ